jgi:predicted enzyme related to lactoylglutathione lyase
VNAGLPAQWLIYVTVADLEASVRRVAELGGALVRPVTDMGGQGRVAIVRDPEGAVCALFQRAGP